MPCSEGVTVDPGFVYMFKGGNGAEAISMGVNWSSEPSLLPYLSKSTAAGGGGGWGEAGVLETCMPSFSWKQGNHCLPGSVSSHTPRRCPKTTHGDCLSPPNPNSGTSYPLDPSLHPQGPASGLPVFSSWADSKCLQYEIQAWCVDLVISIVQECLCMKNKQMPECTTIIVPLGTG